jgi:hypothetical protein
MHQLGLLVVFWLGTVSTHGQMREPPPGMLLLSNTFVYQPCEPAAAYLAATAACANGDASAAQRLSREAVARFAVAEARLTEVVAQRRLAMAVARNDAKRQCVVCFVFFKMVHSCTLRDPS